MASLREELGLPAEPYDYAESQRRSAERFAAEYAAMSRRERIAHWLGLWPRLIAVYAASSLFCAWWLAGMAILAWRWWHS